MEIRRLECGIDYFTATQKQDETWLREAAFKTAAVKAATETQGGEQVERWAWLGYRGWKRGSIRYGSRYDGSMVQCSGTASDRLASLVATEGTHIARLDIQATAWFDGPNFSLAEHAAAAAWAARESGVTSRTLKLSYINGMGDGDTLYVGSRNSEVFFRMYDKDHESKKPEYQYAWRFEIEYKNDKAMQFFKLWKEQENKQAYVSSVIAGYMRSHGLASFQHMGYWGGTTATIRSIEKLSGCQTSMAGNAS